MLGFTLRKSYRRLFSQFPPKFFFSDDSLRSYSKQLTNIANVDQRLVIALQKIHCGDFIYGIDTGQGHLLESYCEEVGLPKRWGNPAQTVPIPCEVSINASKPPVKWRFIDPLN
jgi:hypothetical protein